MSVQVSAQGLGEIAEVLQIAISRDIKRRYSPADMATSRTPCPLAMAGARPRLRKFHILTESSHCHLNRLMLRCACCAWCTCSQSCLACRKFRAAVHPKKIGVHCFNWERICVFSTCEPIESRLPSSGTVGRPLPTDRASIALLHQQ